MYDKEFAADLPTELYPYYMSLNDKNTIDGLHRSQSLQSHILKKDDPLWSTLGRI